MKAFSGSIKWTVSRVVRNPHRIRNSLPQQNQMEMACRRLCAFLSKPWLLLPGAFFPRFAEAAEVTQQTVLSANESGFAPNNSLCSKYPNYCARAYSCCRNNLDDLKRQSWE